MDLLKAEIAKKRKAIDMAKSSADVGKVGQPSSAAGDDDNSGGGGSKRIKGGANSSRQYLKAADLRRFQEEREGEIVASAASLNRDGGGDAGSSDGQGDGEERSSQSSSRREHDRAANNDNDDGKGGDSNSRAKSGEAIGDSSTGDEGQTKKSKKKSSKHQQPPPDEITNMLRALGLPVRLFGERTIRLEKIKAKTGKKKYKYDDAERWTRLQRARELNLQSRAEGTADEFRLGSGHGIRNPFLEKAADDDDGGGGGRAAVPASDGKAAAGSGGGTDTTKEDGGGTPGEAAASASHHHDEDDPHKRIHRFFKTVLKQWEEDLAARPDSVRRTVQGKNETKTLKQCKDYIRPLFKLCKTRKLEDGIMARLLKIIQYCEDGEFVRAHDEYMDVAIGRAAWPIGVTMVGIHARSGRAKIESSNVAHVMNSELQRKYLTSVKRLMTYSQKKAEHVAPSKKVG